ncbi:MAG: lipoate--protein ligase [Oscillospiraceae bacterium]
MLYIPNPSHDPYYNQAFEEFVFNTIRGEDVLLLWRSAPAVVCGCYQNVFAEVSVPEALARGVAVVRRPSGGGTVFHDLGNLNYTLIRSCDAERVEYESFLRPVVAALRRVGVPASVNRTSDIAVDGLKVSGSAQRVVKGRVLHHGTLLYSTALGELTALANGRRAFFESKGVPSVPWPVTNMIEHMEDRSLSVGQFQQRLLEALGENGGIETYRLTAEEERQVRELAESKYRSWEWNFGKSPAFTYRRRFTLHGAERQVAYQANKGVIREISFDPPEPALSEALTGRRLELTELRALLRYLPGYEELYLYLF